MNTTFDFLENKIKIETRFRIDVTEYINKIYKTRKNSILPYDINTEDVFEMLQDLTWSNDEKFVVFFNFEFVMCLMKLRVNPDRIIYIAPSKESFYEVRDGGWGKLGMKSILFDLNIYKEHKKRNKWKNYLMKKIGKLDEFIAVGNIPFTVNNSNSDNSKKLGNDFIKIMNQFKKSCYILQAKFNNNVFHDELVLNRNLKKMVLHQKSIFDIADCVKTCHVVIDNEEIFEEFIYTTNVINKNTTFKKYNNICLNTNPDFVYYLDENCKTIGDLWTCGKVNSSDLKDSGKYKVVKSVGRKKDNFVNIKYSDIENSTIGSWKVVTPMDGSGTAVKVVPPDTAITHRIVAFLVKDEISAKNLKKYMESDYVVNLWKSLKTATVNSKGVFSKIPLPDELI